MEEEEVVLGQMEEVEAALLDETVEAVHQTLEEDHHHHHQTRDEFAFLLPQTWTQ